MWSDDDDGVKEHTSDDDLVDHVHDPSDVTRFGFSEKLYLRRNEERLDRFRCIGPPSSVYYNVSTRKSTQKQERERGGNSYRADRGRVHLEAVVARLHPDHLLVTTSLPIQIAFGPRHEPVLVRAACVQRLHEGGEAGVFGLFVVGAGVGVEQTGEEIA